MKTPPDLSSKNENPSRESGSVEIASDPSDELHVALHDRDPFRVQGAQV